MTPRWFIGICIIFFHLPLQGQPNLDSLFQALPGAEQVDSVKIYMHIETYYTDTGDLEKALEYGQLCVQVGERLGDEDLKARALNNLGIVYRRLRLNEDAKDCFERALASFEQLGDSAGILYIRNNLGVIQWKLGEYDHAIAHFEMVKMYQNIRGDKKREASVLHNLGLVYLEQKEHEKADAHFSQAVELFRETKNDWSLANALTNQGINLAEMGELAKAEKVLDEAIEFSKAKELDGRLMNVYGVYYGIYKGKKDFQKAIEYLRSYYDINDSLNSTEKNKEIARLKAEFDDERKVQENALLNLKNKRLTSIQRISIIVIILISLLTVVLFRQARLRKRANELLNLQARDLIRSREAAEAASKAKADFLSVMSHEIRTPMNAVNGLINHLSLQSPRQDQGENFEVLQFSAKNLLTILNDILEFNRLEAEKIAIETRSFNLKELILNLRKTYSFKAKEKGIDLHMDWDDQMPTNYLGDVTRLGQVLGNLLGNAIKFTETGYIKVTVKNASEDTLLFQVQDTGIGIAQEKLELIFEQFVQSSSEITRKYGGTGLGLAISQKLVKLMGGVIEVHSTVGEGSTFQFSLQLPPTELVTEATSKTSLPQNRSINGLSILVVEDNPVNQIVVKKFLNRWGLITDTAKNGQEGLEKIQANTYDLVLMDLQMPVMDGREAIKQIRQLPDTEKAQIPIIAMTASVLDVNLSMVSELGVDGYVMKPFEPEHLKDTISMYAKEILE